MTDLMTWRRVQEKDWWHSLILISRFDWRRHGSRRGVIGSLQEPMGVFGTDAISFVRDMAGPPSCNGLGGISPREGRYILRRRHPICVLNGPDVAHVTGHNASLVVAALVAAEVAVMVVAVA